MTAVVLDGVTTATAVKNELAARIAALKASGVVPGLGTLLVGEDPGSLSYVAGKHRDCAEVGIESIRVDLPAEASEDDIMAAGREGVGECESDAGRCAGDESDAGGICIGHHEIS